VLNKADILTKIFKRTINHTKKSKIIFLHKIGIIPLNALLEYKNRTLLYKRWCIKKVVLREAFLTESE